MKGFLGMVIAFILFASCALGPSAWDLRDDGMIYTGHEPELEGPITDMVMWIHENIKYETDQEHFGMYDYWAPRSVVLQDLQGDCEDQSNLLLLAVRDELGIEGKLAMFYCPDSGSWHACAYIDGVYYDPLFTTYQSFRNWWFSYYVSFDTVAFWADR
jgi:hypothetical protein